MVTRDSIISPKDCPPGENLKSRLVTFKAFLPFLRAVDVYWKDNGYRNRTHFVFRTVAKKIKWRGEI